MKKEDFKVGQNVYVYLLGNAARGKKTDDERIEEWEVVSVGRKYIQAKKKTWRFGEELFDITDNFRHSNHGNPREYELYPTKDELLNELWRRNVRRKISKYSDYSSSILEQLNDKELETIYNILQKYAEDTK